jgi:hypothetical protein
LPFSSLCGAHHTTSASNDPGPLVCVISTPYIGVPTGSVIVFDHPRERASAANVPVIPWATSMLSNSPLAGTGVPTIFGSETACRNGLPSEVSGGDIASTASVSGRSARTFPINVPGAIPSINMVLKRSSCLDTCTLKRPN